MSYQKYDPICNFLATHAEISESFISVLVLFMVFDFICQREFYQLNVQSVPWRWWHQLIVLHQDVYYQSLIEDQDKLNKIYQVQLKHFKHFAEFLKNIFFFISEKSIALRK